MVRIASTSTVLAVLLGLAACGDDGGSGGAGGSGPTTSTSVTSAPSSTATGSSGCDAGAVCTPAAPAGWSGPIAFYVGAAAAPLPACPAAFPSLAGDTFSGLLGAEPATCVCACEAPTGGSCTTSASNDVDITDSHDLACTALCGGAETNDAGTCIPVVQGSCGAQPTVAQLVVTSAPDLTGASCAPTSTVTQAVPTWDQAHRACAAGSLPSCADGVCAPVPEPPFAAALCVSSAGDLACPSGYPTKTVVYDAFEDTRGCSTCTCGGATGMTCEGTMTAHAQPGCATSLGSWDVPGCVPWLPTPGTNYVRFNLAPTGGSCAAMGGTPTGEVVGTGPTTVCCAP